MNSDTDLFYQFADLYEKGEFRSAFQTIITHPAISYDTLFSKLPIFHALVNHIDACVFFGFFEAMVTAERLKACLLADSKHAVLLDGFIDVLHQQELFQNKFFSKSGFKNKKAAENIDAVPPLFIHLFHEKLKISMNWHTFATAKPSFVNTIKTSHSFGIPPIPFSFSGKSEPLMTEAKGIPVIFFQPFEVVDTAFFQSLKGRPSVVVFETISMLLHALQNDEILKFLIDSLTFLYILEEHPLQQSPLFSEFTEKDFNPILMDKHIIYLDIIPVFTDALKGFLQQPKENFQNETIETNRLYQIAKKMLVRSQSHRWGKSRAIATVFRQRLYDWFDPHKDVPAPEINAISPGQDFLKEIYQEASEKRPARRLPSQGKLRLAHIVSQIVDGGHAPSRVLRSLVANADLEHFELFVFSTEFLVMRNTEYPLAGVISPPSETRGEETIKDFKQRGAKVFIHRSNDTYKDVAHHVAKQLSALQIDIAVFHGPDEINSLIAAMTDVPLRVMYEHGTIPKYPYFDYVITSSEEAAKEVRLKFQNTGMDAAFLKFCIGLTNPQKVPYTKEQLGLSKDAFIMTTISNHLENRLSQNMCHAIGEILKNHPRAMYMPMGRMVEPEKIRSIFEIYGINDRVVFLGSVDNPRQIAGAMDLYLNEFPFGSALGMLEAMAAGCPVVSMYDENGPPQARYGGAYFGVDRVIHSGNKDDYVKLASRYITDREFYLEASQHALNIAKGLMDERAYTERFQNICLEQLKKKAWS